MLSQEVTRKTIRELKKVSRGKREKKTSTGGRRVSSRPILNETKDAFSKKRVKILIIGGLLGDRKNTDEGKKTFNHGVNRKDNGVDGSQ